MKQRPLYLILAIIGFLAPYVIFFVGVSAQQIGPANAISDIVGFFSNPVGLIMLVWLFTSGIALTAFITHEALVRRDYYLFWAVLAILVAGIGAALPFYLYLRSPK